MGNGGVVLVGWGAFAQLCGRTNLVLKLDFDNIRYLIKIKFQITKGESEKKSIFLNIFINLIQRRNFK